VRVLGDRAAQGELAREFGVDSVHDGEDARVPCASAATCPDHLQGEPTRCDHQRPTTAVMSADKTIGARNGPLNQPGGYWERAATGSCIAAEPKHVSRFGAGVALLEGVDAGALSGWLVVPVV
jgi:hypothetical protein